MPVLLEAGGMLALILAFMVASGLALVYREAFARAIIGLADTLDRFAVGAFGRSLKPLAPLAAWLRWFDRSIEGLLGAAVVYTERGVVLLWHGLAAQAKALGELLGSLAETVEARFHHLLFLFPPAALLWATVRAVQAIPRLWDLAHAAAHKAAAAYAAVVDSGAWVRGRFRDVGRDITGLAKRVRANERRLVGAGAAAMVGVALARLGLGWLRCPRVGRLGKQACGMDLGLLESMVADTLLIASTVSLVAFAHELQQIEGEVVKGIRGFVREA